MNRAGPSHLIFWRSTAAVPLYQDKRTRMSILNNKLNLEN
jgi:hypothetical protein